jgi:hypothetical protein
MELDWDSIHVSRTSLEIYSTSSGAVLDPKRQSSTHAVLIMAQFSLSSGAVVYFSDEHLAQHQEVVKLLPECFELLGNFQPQLIAVDIDLRRVVGQTICVATNPTDQIVYAQRVGRAGYTRFVMEKQPQPTSHITIVAKHLSGGSIQLITAYMGRKATPEPWDRRVRSILEQQGSRLFWDNHALIWGHQQVSGDPVIACPWDNHPVDVAQ